MVGVHAEDRHSFICIQQKKIIWNWHTNLKPGQWVVLLPLVLFALPVLFWRFFLLMDFCSFCFSSPDWLMCFTCELSSGAAWHFLHVSVDFFFFFRFRCCFQNVVVPVVTLHLVSKCLCLVLLWRFNDKVKTEGHSKWPKMIHVWNTHVCPLR